MLLDKGKLHTKLRAVAVLKMPQQSKRNLTMLHVKHYAQRKVVSVLSAFGDHFLGLDWGTCSRARFHWIRFFIWLSGTVTDTAGLGVLTLITQTLFDAASHALLATLQFSAIRL